ncbi:hypothetical protein ACWWU7_12685 [Stenotrophomonas sp. SM006]|uniref:hypothetical protein n=1 Tax=Stenotrophomonas maltophilia TaxID=40324 RepID=UPI000D1AACFB|nr:hypothetical protein [Stenotrophomonas maltophilia]QDY51283.1 hypothetical protein DUW70_23555 [Stenotrophomonas maltophilia]HBP01981.1 hypothetical protein [Stenotrophomonas sp.]
MPGVSDASEQSIDVAAIDLNAEHEHIPLLGDTLAAVVGELEGDATPGASIGRVLEALAERLERTTCRVQTPVNDSSRSSGVICSGPDVDSLFPYYTALRQASTPAEHDRHGGRLLDAYATLLRDAPDVALTRPSEDEAADGLLHVLFPFEAWDKKLNIPRHDVHFPFVPVCNLVVARAARCPGADQLRRQIRQAGDESAQHRFCIEAFSRRQLELSDGCSE